MSLRPISFYFMLFAVTALVADDQVAQPDTSVSDPSVEANLFAPEEQVDVTTLEEGKPAPAAPGQEVGMDFDVPGIGKVKLLPTPEGTKPKGMMAKLADKDKKMELGPLVLDDATIILADSGAVSLTGRGTLLNKSVRVGVKEYKAGRMVLEITFINHDSGRSSSSKKNSPLKCGRE